MITAFEGYALNDIRKNKEMKLPIAAFILSVCFIDQVSGFIYHNKIKQGTERCKNFVEDYLNKVATKQYNKNDLIDLLRNKLVHNYSVSDIKKPKHIHYRLEWENRELHLLPYKGGLTINLDCFIDDLEKAFNVYKHQLQSDPIFQKVAIEHYNEFGILIYHEYEIKYGPE